MSEPQTNHHRVGVGWLIFLVAVFITAITALIVLCGNQTYVSNDVKELVAMEQIANDKCRDGFINSDKTQYACDNRDKYYDALFALGWCYGKNGEAEYQKQWHPCTADSYQIQRSASVTPVHSEKQLVGDPNTLLREFLSCAKYIFTQSPHPEKVLVWLGCDSSMKYLEACADKMQRNYGIDKGTAFNTCAEEANAFLVKLHDEVISSRNY